MKIIALFDVVVVCVLLHLIIQVNSEELNEEEISCIVTTKIEIDEVVQAKKTSTVPADNPNYKNFLSCCWKAYGYQNEENGDINWKKIQEVLEETYKPKIAAKLIKKCDTIQGKTDGDTVALVLLCLDEHAPNVHAVHGYYAGHHSE